MTEKANYNRAGLIALLAAIKKQAESDLKRANATYKGGKPKKDDLYSAKWWLDNRLPAWKEVLPEIANCTKSDFSVSDEKME